ncbi:chalcone isomerase family protein [Tepidimonas sp.]|uniref:chalcone isomerase family protein n=1 Tax=Tepidimonas sp. TaxID=2002775 RepID=UPI00391C1DF5
MSCSTRWSSRDWAVWALGVACLSGPPTWASTPAAAEGPASTSPATAAPALGELLPGAVRVGEGTLRFLGLAVYDARLLAPPGWHAEALGRTPLVLELTYRRAFRGADIARRSLEEMRRAGPIPATDEATWRAAMQRIFPDVGPGDRIAGVWLPGSGARFTLTGADGQRRALGDVADARFAERFFGIWLAPTTSEPGLRQALLGSATTTASP